MKSIIVVSKENGKVSNMQAVIDQVKLWLQICMNGEYTISMKKVVKTRSNQQNKLMWVWFSHIARAWSEATGRVFTKEEVYNAYCLQFLPIDSPMGRTAGHTSTLTQEKMSEFLDRVKVDALESYGIELPNAEDNFFAALAEEYSNN